MVVAILYVLLCMAIVAVYFKQRKTAFNLVLLAAFFSLVIFWHHLTNILDINL